jgi:probable nitrogen fixation protein
MLNSSVISEKSPVTTQISHPFLTAFINQFRATDQEDIYQDWSDDELLNAVIVSPSQKYAFRGKSNRHLSSQLTRLQVTAFYQTVAQLIEEKTGKIPQVFLNLSSKGLSSALIFCGNLLVTYEWFVKLNEFGFDSLESLVKTGEILAHNASLKVQDFF